MNINFLNPFSKHFLSPEKELSREIDIEVNKNSHGISDNFDAFNQYLTWGYNRQSEDTTDFLVTGITFDQIFQDKFARIQTYRQISKYPVALRAINIICDECVVENAHGKLVDFGITENFDDDFDQVEREQLQQEFNYIIETVFKSRDNLFELFKKWLIDGELFLEIIPNKEGNSIIGVKTLPPFYTFPIYDEDIVVGYAQKIPPELSNYYKNKNETAQEMTDDILRFLPEQISYINSGDYGLSRQDVRGYLEPAIRTYNQLKSIEDAMVVYILTRAPEKRLWNVEVGRMTPTKAEEYVKRLMHRYRKQINFNSETGAIDSAKNIQSMVEDYWFPKVDGNGTTVDTLAGGVQFAGFKENVQMFYEQFYDALQIPQTRRGFESGAMYSAGDEIAQEEYNFSKMNKRLQKRFRKVILNVFIQHLRLRGYKQKYLNRNVYDIQMIASNFFEEYKSFKLNEQKSNILQSFVQYIPKKENVSGEGDPPLFSKQFLMENILLFTDSEMLKNDTLLKKEIEEIQAQIEASPPEEENTGNW